MLVHAPIACWLLVPFSDAAAFASAADFFWRVGALVCAVGVISGALAATAGAMDYQRARLRAGNLVNIHAGLMLAAWAASGASLLGRLGEGAVAAPAPLWAVLASAVALILMLAGAWCGGEMVYGRGVGVRPCEERAGKE